MLSRPRPASERISARAPKVHGGALSDVVTTGDLNDSLERLAKLITDSQEPARHNHTPVEHHQAKDG